MSYQILEKKYLGLQAILKNIKLSNCVLRIYLLNLNPESVSILDNKRPNKIKELDIVNLKVISSLPKKTEREPATTGCKYMNNATFEDST